MKIGNRGFSLIEILIAIGILAIIMAMNSQLLQDFVRMQTQQNVIVTNQFETTIGLEMLRNDVSSAGFGLADSFRSPPGIYTEAAVNPALQFNSAPNVPLPLNHGNDVSGFAGYAANSDYLVIRSPAVGMSPAAGKWTNIVSTDLHKWNDVNLDMVNGQDYMVVVKPRTALGNQPGAGSELIVSGGTYALLYNNTSAVNGAFQPDTTKDEKFLVFGIGTVTDGIPV
ncbi:MAG: prepilin-type N-terminal cleavage/methylation domain-containing protein, partial [Syntrophorhabdaceae bacterium]